MLSYQPSDMRRGNASLADVLAGRPARRVVLKFFFRTEQNAYIDINKAKYDQISL